MSIRKGRVKKGKRKRRRGKEKGQYGGEGMGKVSLRFWAGFKSLNLYKSIDLMWLGNCIKSVMLRADISLFVAT